MTLERVQRTADDAVPEAQQLDHHEIADFTVNTDGIGVTTVATRVLGAQRGMAVSPPLSAYWPGQPTAFAARIKASHR